MRFFKTKKTKKDNQPISLPNLPSSYGATDLKETKTSLETRCALDIIQERMTHPPIEIWAGRLENKVADRITGSFKKNIIHLVYKNNELAKLSAAELKNKFNIIALRATLENYGTEDKTMITLIGATSYLERHGDDACIIRIKGTELAKLNISVDLNQIDFTPLPNPISTPTPATTPATSLV